MNLRIAAICCTIAAISLCGDALNAQGQVGSIVLWEGSGCTQDVVCILASSYKQRYNFKSDDNDCVNDEARSMTLRRGMAAGVEIILTDEPDGTSDDDYVNIRTLQSLTSDVCVGSFHSDTIVDGVVQVDATYINGLDGSVSYIGIYP